MTFCVECGSRLAAEAAFCGECGKRVDAAPGEVRPLAPLVRESSGLAWLRGSRRLAAAAVLILLVVSFAALRLRAIRQSDEIPATPGTAASCVDEAGDVVYVDSPHDDSSFGEVESPGDAPYLDLRAVELETTEDELLVRVAMADGWLPSYDLRVPNAFLRMRNEFGKVWSLHFRVGSRGPGSRATATLRAQTSDELVPAKLAEGLEMGHDGPVVEAHVPLTLLEGLGRGFGWWVEANAVTDIVQGDGRLQWDRCGAEGDPLDFPGDPLDESELTAAQPADKRL
jgi:hypothetical protein